MYAASPLSLLGFSHAPGSIVTTKPDVTLHELEKYLKLCLGCNPTAMELMWLPEHLYTVKTELGVRLLELREYFLFERGVRDSYLGYATQQFRKVSNRMGDDPTSAPTPGRIAKNARHLYRLLIQGFQLYSTGTMTVELDDPEKVRNFGEYAADGDLFMVQNTMKYYENLFNDTESVLPSQPCYDLIESWLVTVRLEMLHETYSAQQ